VYSFARILLAAKLQLLVMAGRLYGAVSDVFLCVSTFSCKKC
jgi:hypothetical protein